MQESLRYLRKQSFDVRDEDQARLSRLVHRHVNVLGHYSSILEEGGLKVELRPLNKPQHPIEIP
jgi:hypothetical protein